MWKMLATSAAILALAGSSAVLADQPAGAQKPATTTGQKTSGPCEEIESACKSAGFVQGDAKQGNGLWVDCVDPIMQGAKQPAKATKPLPSVSADVVSACKQKNPKFGEGHKQAAKSS
jgi:hypothetical protein